MTRLSPAAALVMLAAMTPFRPASVVQNDAVTSEQIGASGAKTAYEALRRLRPAWLRSAHDGDVLAIVVPEGEARGDGDRRCGWMIYVGDKGATRQELGRIVASRVREIRLIPAHAPRPDGSVCAHSYPAIQVLLVAPGSDVGAA